MGQCFCTALCQLEKHPNPKALTEKESVRSKKGMKTAPEPSDSESERYNNIAWRKPSLMDYRGHHFIRLSYSHIHYCISLHIYTVVMEKAVPVLVLQRKTQTPNNVITTMMYLISLTQLLLDGKIRLLTSMASLKALQSHWLDSSLIYFHPSTTQHSPGWDGWVQEWLDITGYNSWD